jgi:hypothetical protein
MTIFSITAIAACVTGELFDICRLLHKAVKVSLLNLRAGFAFEFRGKNKNPASNE